MALLVSGTEQNNWNLAASEQLEINVAATSYALTADTLVNIEVQLGNATNLLDAAGGILAVTVKVTSTETGDQCIMPQKQMNLVAGDQLARISVDSFWAKSGDTIEVHAKSSNANDSSVGGKVWIVNLTPAGGGDATEAKQDLIIEQTDKFDSMITEQSAGNKFTELSLEDAPSGTGSTPAAFVAALLAETGWTEGGTMSIETLYKILAAWVGGTWRDKPSDSSVKQLLDVDDDATVILEITLATGTPFKVATVS